MTETLKIEFIPVTEMPFTTLGHWQENPDGTFDILISHMSSKKFMLLVLVHEITEWIVCQAKVVKTKDCDDFDELWENELKNRQRTILDDPGLDPQCPYRLGHIWGNRMERLFAWITGVKWKDYLKECDRLLEERLERNFQ